MFRKLLALLPIAACLVAAADAAAIPLDYHGTGDWRPDPRFPKVAPNTQCQSLMLFLADAPASPSAMRKYRFTGTCTINVAPVGKAVSMRTLPVLIDAEYMPGMKRASERVVVQDPDLGIELSTWATCPSDPFVGTNVACTDKGMGANKFDKFINVDDAPFAHQRATASQVSTAAGKWATSRDRGVPASAFYQSAKVASVQPVSSAHLGAKSSVTFAVTGGAGYCPSEVDFGDGKKETVILWSPNQAPFQHTVEHQYATKGNFTVKVYAHPGCAGGGSVSAQVL